MIERIQLNGTLALQVAGSPDAARAMIVLQEAFGVNNHIRDVTQRFADHGYFAVAPELFHRNGSPEIAYDSFQDAMGALGNLTAEGITEDLESTCEYLTAQGFNTSSIGVVGYCMGGAVAMYADSLGLVGAAVSFYGGGVVNGRFGLAPLVDQAPNITAPWLGLYGDLDQGIPVEQVEALREAAAQSSTVTEIVRYPDAQHGFHCDVREASYNAQAAADAAARAYTFFDTHLSQR